MDNVHSISQMQKRLSEIHTKIFNEKDFIMQYKHSGVNMY